jgi:hypothetical protein
MAQNPKIKIEEIISDLILGNEDYFDIYTVNHKKKENLDFVRVYVTASGKTKVYIANDAGLEILEWKGAAEFRKDVMLEEEEFESK